MKARQTTSTTLKVRGRRGEEAGGHDWSVSGGRGVDLDIPRLAEGEPGLRLSFLIHAYDAILLYYAVTIIHNINMFSFIR